MRDEPVVAIAGATGIIGSEMISVMNEMQLSFSEVRLLASSKSEGEIYAVLGDEIAVEVLDEAAFEDVDIVLFATKADLSQEFVPLALDAGACVIDTSNYYRLNDDVPLVVAEINPYDITGDTKQVSSPNASVVQLTAVLNVIKGAAELKRVVVSTFQSVSGAGKSALDELWDQTRSVFRQADIVTDVFQHQIAFNCIPQIDVFLQDGSTKEEERIINECRKILKLPDLKMSVTAVRVPVFHSHAQSVNVETNQELQPEELNKLFDDTGEIQVFHSYTDYPMPLGVVGRDEVFVGRVRSDLSVEHGLNLWSVCDNIRRGAALNALKIAEILMEVHG